MTPKTKKEILEEKITNIPSDLLESSVEQERIREECYFLLKEHGACNANQAHNPSEFRSNRDLNVYPRVPRNEVFQSRVLRSFLIEKNPSWEKKAFYMALFSSAYDVASIVEGYIQGNNMRQDSDLEHLIMFLKFINGANKTLEKEKHYKELYTKEEINIVYKAALKLLKTKK